MNVAFDPWIPLVTNSGKLELVSLAAVFSEGDRFADLAVRPHERVALMRLFTCVAHAALDGPKSYEDWCEVPEKLPKAALKYLTIWKDSFELFHEKKPWLQVAELSKAVSAGSVIDDISTWTPASKLNFSFATGNASTLFDHEGMIPQERKILLHEAVLSMLTFQCFSLGGLIGQVFWNGNRCGVLANPKKENGPVKSADGPCAPSSMLHAFLRGKTFFKTICLNLPTFDDVLRFSYNNFSIGKPVWEMMPTSLVGCENIINATETYLGRLVPLVRLLRFHSSGKSLLLGNGYKYRSFANGFPQEPTATVIINQDERVLLSYRPARAIWRELGGIVVRRNTEGVGGPLSLRSIQDGQDCDLVVAALARDKATVVDVVESVFSIPSQLLVTGGAESYESEVQSAESLASRLGWAIEIYRREVDQGWEGRLKAAGPAKRKLKARLHENGTNHYWTSVEKNLPLLMAHVKALDTDDAISTRNNWRKLLYVSARDAYELACGQETPRQRRAFAKGWQKLIFKKDQSDTNNDKNTEESP